MTVDQYTSEQVLQMAEENVRLRRKVESYEKEEHKETRTLLEIAEEERP